MNYLKKMKINSSSDFFTNKKLIIYLILLLGAALKILYVYQFDDYYDDWNFLYTVDPNISNEETWKRYFGDRGDWFLPEDFPYYFAFIVKFFLKIVGYSVENTHFFLLFFSIGSFFVFMKICDLFSKDSNFKILAVFLLITNIFLTRELNALRPHALTNFFGLLSLYYFILIYLKNKNSYKNIIIFIFITLFFLSIWPLNLTLFAGQCAYILKLCIERKGKNLLSFILPFIIVVLLYLVFNFKYLDYQVVNKSQHYTTLEAKFFINYFFRSFFGSIIFGAIFLLLFSYYLLNELIVTLKLSKYNLILFLKKLKQENVFLIIIITIYSLIILYSLIKAPVMAPKYVTILVPLIIFWVSFKIYKTKNKLIYHSIILFSFLNLLIYWNDIPIKRPPTKMVLKEIAKSETKDLFTTELIFFNNYLQNYNISLRNNITVQKFELEKFKKLPKNFWFLCLNNPSFAVGDNDYPDEKKCFKYKENKNLTLVKIIRYRDYILQLIKKN